MCRYQMEFKPTVNEFMNTGLMKLQVTYYVQAINTVKYESTAVHNPRCVCQCCTLSARDNQYDCLNLSRKLCALS